MRVACAALLLFLLLVQGACRREGTGPPRPRLVLLYATCTLKQDSVAPYGRRIRHTPNLAAFARESIVFARHQTETDQSGPAYASIFSGAQVDRHGVFRHPARLSDELYLMAEAFADQGYETHFWSGHPMASAHLNYSQGVRADNVHERIPGVADLYSLTANDADFAAILDRLRREPDYRAFVQVNFTITHGPYTRTDPRAVDDFRSAHPDEWPALSDVEIAHWARIYEDNYLRLQWDFPALTEELGLKESEIARLADVVELYYKASVRLLDHCFGRVVDSIRRAKLLDESLIAFTADHGETLYRDTALFKWTHGAEIAPEAISVPLILRLPGSQRRAGRYEGVSRSTDVYPTLAGLSGFTVGAARGVDGMDLSAAVLGSRRPPGVPAFSHTTLLGPELVQQFQGWLVSEFHPTEDVDHMWVSARVGDLYGRLRKLETQHWGMDLFDVGEGVETVRYDPDRREHRDLARELAAYRARLLGKYRDGVRAPVVPEAEVRERLRALGYVE